MSSLSTSSDDGISYVSSNSFSLQWLRQRETPKCFENGPQCITTTLYYFECCKDDCCVRAQPLVKVIILIVGIALFVVILLKSYQRLKKVHKIRRNRVKVQLLLDESQLAGKSSEKKEHIVIQCW